jgi:phage-related protein
MIDFHGVDLRPLIWVGSSRRDFAAFPEPIKNQMGYSLYVAQQGQKHRDAKPLKGFGGASVIEIVSDYRGDAFRAVYTVRFSSAVYVLHVFQKKSKIGRETSKIEIDLIERRLREAEKIERERKA